MNYISSTQNEQVKHIVDLRNKSYRYEHGQFTIEGTRACTQLFEKYKPVAIYMTEKYYKTHTFTEYEDIIIGTATHVMDKMCTTKNPSGICAILSIPEEKPLPATGPGLVLVDVSDPGNLGTLIRTAAAMNIKEVILVGGVDPYNSKVIQSTVGCFTIINLYQTTFEKVLTQKEINLCALVVKDGLTPEKINLKNKFLVVGSEAHGLSPQHIQACHEKMTLPMPGQAESLNAGVAGSIGLYLMSLQN
jgi:RNA methyltransferase, TrmH family